MNIKRIALIVLACFIGFTGGFFARPVLAYAPVDVEVNDKVIQFPDQGAYIDKVSGRSYVPIRFVAEQFGAKVNWDQDTKTATIQTVNPENLIKLTVGDKVMIYNGAAYYKQMDAPPQIENKRVMIPARFVSEVIGKYVLYDEKNRLVRISDKPFVETDKLSPEQIKRLQSYPFKLEYHAGNKNPEPPTVDPGEGFGELYKQTITNPDFQFKSILDQYLNGVDYYHLLQNNQRFITDEKLIAGTQGDCSCLIRGIVQTTYPDGSITEKDVEFGMAWGFEMNSEPGQPRQPDHWLSDTLAPRTIDLSKERKVK